ncbi:hypothetical protein ACFC0D_15765 [Streptomyces sp. NPDC056222]|uniref:hypothetical protein n=1 Tax=Streptomyces sp. NPDC056222 TaxID=3345749 RepID=UPI0035D57610
MATLLTPRSRRSTGDDSTRLVVPPGFRTALGCDAVGVPARYGFRILSRLPAKGCVYADTDWWWWLVPTGSDLELTWPMPACYAPGAEIPDRRPRLIHRPDGTSPYTPPIPLYLLACQLTGTAPSWTLFPTQSDGVMSEHVHPSGPDRP